MNFIGIRSRKQIKSIDIASSLEKLLKSNPKVYSKYVELYTEFLRLATNSLNKAYRHFILMQGLKKADNVAQLQAIIEEQLAVSKGFNLGKSSMKHIPKKSDFRIKPEKTAVVGVTVDKGVAKKIPDKGAVKRATKRAKIIDKARKQITKRKVTTKNK